MQIRPFRLADEAAVVALWAECRLTRPLRFRGRGFGRALVEHVEHALLERGCPKINLQVRASNPEAIAFYRRLGYAPEESISLGKRLIAD